MKKQEDINVIWRIRGKGLNLRIFKSSGLLSSDSVTTWHGHMGTLFYMSFDFANMYFHQFIERSIYPLLKFQKVYYEIFLGKFDSF